MIALIAWLPQIIYSPTTNVAKFWSHIGSCSDYILISRVAHVLCLIPHSNAVAERVFSMTGKNLTASRKALDKNSTLSNIMIVKCANWDSNFMPSSELQTKAKSATCVSLLDYWNLYYILFRVAISLIFYCKSSNYHYILQNWLLGTAGN